jgi:2-oxoacid:acceptor oxidoreductase gamma subunit (pyruvate/2-ketoisovalerate family)
LVGWRSGSEQSGGGASQLQEKKGLANKAAAKTHEIELEIKIIQPLFMMRRCQVMAELLEVRWHGRGGLGAVTSAELLARAAISEGKYAQSFPSFGPERRGAPVIAFLRISDEFIRTRTPIDEPDVVVVLDPGLLHAVDVTSGLKKNSKIIINSRKSPSELKSQFGYKWPVGAVNATMIAKEAIGVPITNTSMIGALLKVTEAVGLDSVIEQLNERFGARAKGNIEAMKRAYKETVIEE